MIDLDAVWTDTDELYCQFGAALVMNKLTYNQFLKMRGSLLADRYVWPDNRILHVPLVTYLTEYQANCTNVSWFFSLYLNMSHIFAHYTEAEQIRILEILNGDWIYSLPQG